MLSLRSMRLIKALPIISTWVSIVLLGFSTLGFAQEAGTDDTNDILDTNSTKNLTLTLDPNDVSLNLKNCDTLSKSREFNLSGLVGTTLLSRTYEVRILASTGSSCSFEDACQRNTLDSGNCSCLAEGDNVSSLSASFKIEELFDEICVDGEEKTINFFMKYEAPSDPNLGYNAIDEESDVVSITIDLLAPDAPTQAPKVSAAEEALVVTVNEVNGDIAEYEVCVREFGLDENYDNCKTVNPDEKYRFENLANDIEYEVIYRVSDSAGNRSEASPSQTGTPVEVLDFAELYSTQYPGGERGGCEQNGHTSHLPLLLFLIGLVGWYSRRRLNVMNTMVCSLLLVGMSSSVEASPWSSGQSDRTSTVGLLFGSYMPQIDSEFEDKAGIKRPYERVFKNDAPMMMMFHIDKHLTQKYGTFALGGGLARWSVEGNGVSAESTDEKTSMSIMPLFVHLSYRFDYFRKSFPIVPLFKAGLSYYLWDIYDGSGEVANFSTGEKATGGTMGWNYTVGAQVLLDFFDAEMAWAFDRDAGVNHSYLTFEYQVSRVDDFSDPDSFRLGNDTFFIGIALDL